MIGLVESTSPEDATWDIMLARDGKKSRNQILEPTSMVVYEIPHGKLTKTIAIDGNIKDLDDLDNLVGMKHIFQNLQ